MMIPCLRYRDPTVAVEWLCRAFGFGKQLVAEHDGAIVHAQLTFGNGMIMLGPVGDSAYSRHMAQPDEVGGRGTQSIYVVVLDADAHHAQAVAAGAAVTLPLADADYGGRGYSCRDPEGHFWSFGTYDPWAE